MEAKSAWTAIISAMVGALCSYFMRLVAPLCVLIFVIVLDYLTGMAKAWTRCEMSSNVGRKGILKKVGYFAVVCVAGVIDWLLLCGLKSVGIDQELPFLFALIVVVWLIINELISILENLAALGVPVPGFVVKLLAKLKGEVEKHAENEAELTDAPSQIVEERDEDA